MRIYIHVDAVSASEEEREVYMYIHTYLHTPIRFSAFRMEYTYIHAYMHTYMDVDAERAVR